jgi:hypothetical protein
MLGVRPMVYFHENFLKPKDLFTVVFTASVTYIDSIVGIVIQADLTHRPLRRPFGERLTVLDEGLVRERRHAQSVYPLVRQPRFCEVRKGIRSSNSSLRSRLKSSPPPFYVSRSHGGERPRRLGPSTHLSESPPQELAPATRLDDKPRRLPRFHRARPSTALDERRRSPGVFGWQLHHDRGANATLRTKGEGLTSYLPRSTKEG